MKAGRLDRIIRLASRRLVQHQQPNGSFQFCCETSPLTEAIMVIFLNFVGHTKDPLVPKLCRTLRKAQKTTGEWLDFSDQSENISLTTLSYFALKLAGDDPKADSCIKSVSARHQ